MKDIVFSLCMLLALVLPTSAAVAQTLDTLICPVCQQPNNPENNYCTSCGEKLAQKSVSPPSADQPVTYREPARLLSISTANVLPELSIGLTVGNSFGQQEQESFLGNVGIGIGDVAELELNTGGMIGNIVAATTRMTTWSLKVQVLAEKEKVPAVALSLRSSNDWDNTMLDSRTLAASAPDQYNEGLRWINYDMRMTTASVVVTRRIHEQTTLHGTVGISDIRYRNLNARFAMTDNNRFDPSVKRTSQWQTGGGLAIQINPRTTFIAEAQTIPFFNYNVSTTELRLERMYVGAAGIRFALSKAFSLDSGLRYQSNFVGLADTQVRVALNGVFVLPL